MICDKNVDVVVVASGESFETVTVDESPKFVVDDENTSVTDILTCDTFEYFHTTDSTGRDFSHSTTYHVQLDNVALFGL